MENKRSTSLRLSQNSKPVPRDVNESLGKLPPQALDMEEAVLAALLLEKKALSLVIEFLRPEHFYTEQHQKIYQAITDLFKNSEPVDMRTVVAQLRKVGKLELIGGAYYIAQLTSMVSSAANIEYHSRFIVEMSIKREIIQIASQSHHDAYEDTTDVFELLDKTEQAIFKITENNLRKNFESMKALMFKSIKELQERAKKKHGITGVASGLSRLDKITSGWQKNDLVILAARAGMGKTSFVMTACRNAAIDFKMPVGIFSLEMSSMQLMDRLIAAESELEYEKIKKGELSQDEWQKLIQKTTQLTNAPIFIDDTPSLTILELRAKCRRLKAEHGIELIVVDYLQLMQGEKGGTREQEVASISRSLKAVAKELEIAVIALSQLSRATEGRGKEKRPQLSDLRESGSIEQDADLVIMLYRPEYYKVKTIQLSGGDEISSEGFCEILIEKFRNGPAPVSVPSKFIGRYSKFIDYESTPNLFKQKQAEQKDVNVNQNIEPKGKVLDDNEVPF